MPIKQIRTSYNNEESGISIQTLPPTEELINTVNEIISVFNKFERKAVPKLDPRDRKLLNGTITAMNVMGEKLQAIDVRISELERVVYDSILEGDDNS